MEDKVLKLYSPLQVDIIDRDSLGRPVPLQAMKPEREQEYLSRLIHVFGQLQSQEDARNAFVSRDQDWSEICEKVVSATRSVDLIKGKLYGVYSFQSKGELDSEEIESLEWCCRDQWEHGWGEGYAHCPGEGTSLGLYIHFWQDDRTPLLTREQLETVHQAEQHMPAVTEVTPDTFWTLIDQAKSVCGQEQKLFAYWLTERLLAMGPEQTLKFHSVLHGYMELADNHGLWNAALLIQEDGCNRDSFEDFRAWLIAQGKDVYLTALKDPDSLAKVPSDQNYRFEALPYVGDMAYQRLTGRMAYDAVDPEAYQHLLAELRAIAPKKKTRGHKQKGGDAR